MESFLWTLEHLQRKDGRVTIFTATVQEVRLKLHPAATGRIDLTVCERQHLLRDIKIFEGFCAATCRNHEGRGRCVKWDQCKSSANKLRRSSFVVLTFMMKEIGSERTNQKARSRGATPAVVLNHWWLLGETNRFSTPSRCVSDTVLSQTLLSSLMTSHLVIYYHTYN